MMDYISLKLIWWGIFGFLIIAFMISGGMDIGVGFLLPIVGKSDQDRRLILNAIGPTWEGNQVWLITLGAALFAIWPLAYGTIFSSLYVPFILVLFMLILRPPGIDYRSKLYSYVWRGIWDWGLFTSATVVALGFGAVAGTLFTGLPFYFDQDLRMVYEGSFFTILTPIALIFAIVNLFMLGLQGALYLQYKLEDELALRAKRMVKVCAAGFTLTALVAAIAVITWVPSYKILNIPDLNTNFMVNQKTVIIEAAGWAQNYVHAIWLWVFPILAFIATLLAVILSKDDKPATALLLNSLGIAGSTITVGVALFPFVMPSNIFPNHSLTLWDVCATELTLKWALVATAILIPFVLLYTSWVYRVMRGKVKMQAESY